MTIRYVRLLDFCFCCGRIGHAAKECFDTRDHEEADKNCLEYGAWLKFQGFNKLTKKPDIPFNNDKSKDQNQNTGDKEEREKRAREDLDVDLNLESPVTEEPEKSGKLCWEFW